MDEEERKLTLKERKMVLVIHGFTEHGNGIGRCGNHWTHKNFDQTRLSLKEAEAYMRHPLFYSREGGG
ncbi:MAG: hypothetical protein CMF45_08745 [Legionellales bacterium]|nr:hypothetical protein [Legionellales bacterium]|tara:strand:+ start:438 stop:641 length:204 start_codon:yes stop_codon:yes gene_type:complete